MTINDVIGQISAKTKISRADIFTIMATAPLRYKIYKIKKRDNSDRVIAHPSRELKAIQRALLELFPDNIPLHPSAHAYEKGCSIKKNAEMHQDKEWILKFDLKNFFNSIKSSDWISYLEELNVDKAYIKLSEFAFFWKARESNVNCLSVGAPSSPFVSNRFMFKFDEFVANFASVNNIIYTRYADDLVFSSDNELQIEDVRKVIESGLALVGSMEVNVSKTRKIGPGRRKSVTGIILKDSGGVSLGRKKKRRIEAMLHKCVVKGECVNRDVLIGHLAFLNNVDPARYARLHKKYKLPVKGIGLKTVSSA